MVAFTASETDWRVFIVDGCRANRLEIERSLNGLGFWRIAPLGSFRELRLLTARMLLPVDILIVNRQMDGQEDIWRFCQRHPQIRHTMIYECFESDHALTGHSRMKTLQLLTQGSLSVAAGMGVIAQVSAGMLHFGVPASGSDQVVASGEIGERYHR